MIKKRGTTIYKICQSFNFKKSEIIFFMKNWSTFLISTYDVKQRIKEIFKLFLTQLAILIIF